MSQADRRSLQWAVHAADRPARRHTRGMGATTPGQVSAVGTAVAADTTAAAQAFLNPVSDVSAIFTTLAAFVGLTGNSKALYESFDPKALQAVTAYGPDFITGSAALGLNAIEVASAMSDYLKEDGISLTPQQLLAMFAPPPSDPVSAAVGSISAALGGIPTPVLFGGAGLLLLLAIMKK